jgi:hypothetical protein
VYGILFCFLSLRLRPIEITFPDCLYVFILWGYLRLILFLPTRYGKPLGRFAFRRCHELVVVEMSEPMERIIKWWIHTVKNEVATPEFAFLPPSKCVYPQFLCSLGFFQLSASPCLQQIRKNNLHEKTNELLKFVMVSIIPFSTMRRLILRCPLLPIRASVKQRQE